MRYLTLSGVSVFLAALALPAPAAAQGPGVVDQQTCRDIGVRGSTLYAECKDVNGGWHRTEMADYNRCGADIQKIMAIWSAPTVDIAAEIEIAIETMIGTATMIGMATTIDLATTAMGPEADTARAART